MNDITRLIEALPYIQRYKGRTFVVKLGGELVERADALASIATDVTLLENVGVRVVVVHGGGPQADKLAAQLGLATTRVEGRRITDDDALEVTKMVFAGKINLEVVAALRARGLRVVGLSGVAGDIIHATRRPPRTMTDKDTGETREVDFGHVGDVQSVDTSLLRLMADNGYVPVVACLAGDGEGNVLNINADTVASAIATDLQADKLVVLSNVPGLLRDVNDPASLVRTLTVAEARGLLDDDAVGGGMAPKLQAILSAVEAGVPRAHLLDGVAHNSLLLEVFSKEGTGTMIAKADEVARYRKAIGADCGGDA